MLRSGVDALLRGQGKSSIECREGDSYVLNGHKWWASGAPDPRCKICIFMGKTAPSAPTYKQQSMILVPMGAPGVRVVRPLLVFGYDDAPHGHAEVIFKVRLACGWSNLLPRTICLSGRDESSYLASYL